MSEAITSGSKDRAQGGLLARWKRNADGTTALEFAMIAMPFMSMLFGIIGVGLFFFTTFTLENSVDQAARLLRTGQAQQAGLTAAQFKTQLCSYLPGFVDCTNKVKVNVLTFASTSDITPTAIPSCLHADGTLSNTTQYVPGGASQLVVVWACYEWDLSSKIPFIDLGNMANRARLIQATAVFRTEPYGT